MVCQLECFHKTKLAHTTRWRRNISLIAFLLYLLLECVDGRYGPTCDEDCGHCYSNAVCDKSNGSCPNGCSAGYKWTTCTEGMINTLFNIIDF